MGLVVYQGCC